MAHCVSPAADEILDKEFKVLDKGFVRLVDYLGNDSRIVQAARVSYGKGTKSNREDAALIDYLLRNEHTSPFEQVILTFHCKMPIFVARQWIRHRTARVNEISGRYSIMENEFYAPELADIARQSADNKQGRGETLPQPQALQALGLLKAEQEKAYASYEKLLSLGTAKELARINLPLSLYTEWYWQIDLNNLFHFLKLRLHKHAQKEIRDFAQILLELAEKVAPCAVESFRRHIEGGERLSSQELSVAAKALAALPEAAWGLDERASKTLRGKLGL